MGHRKHGGRVDPSMAGRGKQGRVETDARTPNLRLEGQARPCPGARAVCERARLHYWTLPVTPCFRRTRRAVRVVAAPFPTPFMYLR